jgi:DNA-binding transcriptional MerR regulator
MSQDNNPPSSLLLRIGELSKRTGKTSRTLRYYEEIDLLKPKKRSKGGFRLYHPDTVTRIHWIDRLQDLGFSLFDIRTFLETFRGEARGPAAMDQLRAFYQEKLVETQAAIARLQSLQGELQAGIHYLHTCKSCCPSTLRAACQTCSEHQEATMPSMVAAVAAPF